MPEPPHRGRSPQRRQAPKPVTSRPVSPARRAAFDVLERVETSSAHSDDLLHGPALSPLSQPDRNLATALVLGVLRWQIALDAELNSLLDRPDQPLPLPVRLALRLGAFQLRHMDRIPPHAALSESVELVRAAGQPKAAGLVNAVLRKLLTQPPPRQPIVESIDAAATRLAHPSWLVRRWESTYGRPAALAICDYDQHQPAAGDLFAAASPLDAPADSDDTTEAAADLLDDGSRLVAELAAASHRSPLRIWDACAAPGGKTCILAQRHPAAELLATDVNPRRLRAMQQRLSRTLPGDNLRSLQADATKLPATEGLFDLILCDLPCSGTGTLARNPEIRHRLEPPEFARQAARQREILSAALARLNPGGRLLYSTCSLEPEENEAVVRSILAAAPAVRLLPLDPLLDQLTSSGIAHFAPDGWRPLLRADMLRTLPGANFRGDGFFAALLARD